MKKIAIVNGDNANRNFMGKLVQSVGFDVVLFQNTNIALKGLKYYLDEVGVILIDHSVTPNRVRNLAQSVKSLETTGTLHMIICAHKSESHHYQDLFDQGIGFLSKPLYRKVLKLNLDLVCQPLSVEVG